MSPSTCPLCDVVVADNNACCVQCWREIKFITRPHCPVMGTPFSFDMGPEFLSAEAIASPPIFDRLRASVFYNAPARQLVSMLKYSDRLDLVPLIGRLMLHSGQELLKEADLIIPVPLHRKRLRQRRYNQSGELARHIARSSGLLFRPEFLQRRKHTQQQVGLTEPERMRNVKGAFLVPIKSSLELRGKRVLLVDDVYTTGATSNAAARVLLRAGVAAVDVLVFAKVESGNGLAI